MRLTAVDSSDGYPSSGAADGPRRSLGSRCRSTPTVTSSSSQESGGSVVVHAGGHYQRRALQSRLRRAVSRARRRSSCSLGARSASRQPREPEALRVGTGPRHAPRSALPRSRSPCPRCRGALETRGRARSTRTSSVAFPTASRTLQGPEEAPCSRGTDQPAGPRLSTSTHTNWRSRKIHYWSAAGHQRRLPMRESSTRPARQARYAVSKQNTLAACRSRATSTDQRSLPPRLPTWHRRVRRSASAGVQSRIADPTSSCCGVAIAGDSWVHVKKVAALRKTGRSLVCGRRTPH